MRMQAGAVAYTGMFAHTGKRSDIDILPYLGTFGYEGQWRYSLQFRLALFV